MTRKDIVSIIISLSSLLVSLAVASRAIFYQHEDVIVSIRNISISQVKTEEDLVAEGNLEFIIMNDGTTPIVITDAQYEMSRASPFSTDAKTCVSESDDFIALTGTLQSPLIVKPGDVQVVSVNIASAENMSALVWNSSKKQRLTVCPLLSFGYFGPVSGESRGSVRFHSTPISIFPQSGGISIGRSSQKDGEFVQIINRRRIF